MVGTSVGTAQVEVSIGEMQQDFLLPPQADQLRSAFVRSLARKVRPSSVADPVVAVQFAAQKLQISSRRARSRRPVERKRPSRPAHCVPADSTGGLGIALLPEYMSRYATQGGVPHIQWRQNAHVNARDGAQSGKIECTMHISGESERRLFRTDCPHVRSASRIEEERR